MCWALGRCVRRVTGTRIRVTTRELLRATGAAALAAVRTDRRRLRGAEIKVRQLVAAQHAELQAAKVPRGIDEPGGVDAGRGGGSAGGRRHLCTFITAPFAL